MKVSMGGKPGGWVSLREKYCEDVRHPRRWNSGYLLSTTGVIPAVMRPTNNDGQTAIYTLSLCSEA